MDTKENLKQEVLDIEQKLVDLKAEIVAKEKSGESIDNEYIISLNDRISFLSLRRRVVSEQLKVIELKEMED